MKKQQRDSLTSFFRVQLPLFSYEMGIFFAFFKLSYDFIVAFCCLLHHHHLLSTFFPMFTKVEQGIPPHAFSEFDFWFQCKFNSEFWFKSPIVHFSFFYSMFSLLTMKHTIVHHLSNGKSINRFVVGMCLRNVMDVTRMNVTSVFSF